LTVSFPSLSGATSAARATREAAGDTSNQLNLRFDEPHFLSSGHGGKARRHAPVPGGAPAFQRVFTRLGLTGRPPEFVIEFRPYAGLAHSIRRREGTIFAALSDLLQDAPVNIIEAIAGILLARLYRRRTPRKFLRDYREYAHESHVRQRLMTMRRGRGKRIAHHPQGKFYDLAEIFEKLNRQYFESGISLPRLGWSAKRWRSMLGCYDAALDQIVISKDLDRKKVPRFVVEYIVYHEMLHIKHPQRSVNCRLESHSRKFREEEKLFKEYGKAARFLKGLS